jgi:hypothetical protein
MWLGILQLKSDKMWYKLVNFCILSGFTITSCSQTHEQYLSSGVFIG